MIILIAGTTHTGKTKLAQTLLERFRYPTLSLDHLKMGLIRSGVCDLTPEDDELLVPYLWSITAEIIKTAIENNQNLIVEGCYIPFDWRNSFEPHYLSSMASVLPSRHSSYTQFSASTRNACRRMTRCRVSSASGTKAGTTSKTFFKLRALSFCFCPKVRGGSPLDARWRRKRPF